MTEVSVEKVVVTQDVMTNLRSMDRVTCLSYEDWAKENGVAEFFYKESIHWVLWAFSVAICAIIWFGGKSVSPDKQNIALIVASFLIMLGFTVRSNLSQKWQQEYERQQKQATLGIQRALKKVGAKCYSEKYWLWESGDDQRLGDCLTRMLPTDYLLLVVTEADAEGIDLGS